MSWHFGNVADDSDEHRGWFIGHFMPGDSVQHSQDVEVKWGVHPAGEQREDWHGDEARTTILLLIDGRFRIDLSVGSHMRRLRDLGTGNRPQLAGRSGLDRAYDPLAVNTVTWACRGRSSCAAPLSRPHTAGQAPPTTTGQSWVRS